MSTASPTQRRLEFASALLLTLAAVATAWAAYQAREWTGEQAISTSQATAARIAANRASALANRQLQIDLAIFIQWLDARAEDRSDLADFYRARFRAEFKPAFTSWLATDPFGSGAAPQSPFVMSQYRLKADTRARRLEGVAAADAERAREANQHANNYMLAVVLLATSLFFAGLSIKLDSETAQRVILALGCLVFLAAVSWMATFPVQLTT